MTEIWHLLHRDAVVAELHVTTPDFPWLNAKVVRFDGFDKVQQLFVDELRELNRLEDEETEAWTRAYEAIREATSLQDARGNQVAEYVLHIDGDEAWWRWSDEAFDEA